ncbi:MAG: flagellar motor switch protein FliN [Planctomycetaceae bacterium]
MSTPSATPADASPVAARPIEFPTASGSEASSGQVALSRFYDMSVVVSVELGRVELPLGELLKLGEGSVVELDRAVDEPVDILAQGTPLARGDVVAVNGRYAVRITEIVSPRSSGERLAAASGQRNTTNVHPAAART